MTDYARLEATLVASLQLARRPVAVSFRETPPEDVEQFTGTQPSGCSFWRLAADGRAFYTVPSDHYNCPVGSYTHHIPLPPEREGELSRVLGLMQDIGYIRLEEVPAVPRLPRTPAFAIYAPLGQAPVEPDVVVIAGLPGRLMLLHEAATRASVSTQPMLGRPTCMAIPAALAGAVASSLGCIGNRVYTGVADEEFYTVVRGQDLPAVLDQMGTVVTANLTLADYHRERLATLASS